FTVCPRSDLPHTPQRIRLSQIVPLPISSPFFFFNAPPTTEIYTLSLHDALPILWAWGGSVRLAFPACPRASRAASPFPNWLNWRDRKSTRLNSSHLVISYAVFCLKKKKN